MSVKELREMRLVVEGWIRGATTMRETVKNERVRRALIIASIEWRVVERVLRSEIVAAEAKEGGSE